MPYRIRSSDEYPLWMGFIFLFNLIVGTGALTLPAVFAKAGWLLSIIVIIILAGISYMTVTFVIETLSCANAVIQWQRLQYVKRDQIGTDSGDDDPTEPLVQRNDNLTMDCGIEQMPLSSQISKYYSLDKKVELGEMAGIFFNDFGRIMFYLCITIYLYGDMSIYAAAVAKSLRDVICQYNASNPENITEATLCWETHTMSRLDIYRLLLIAFITLLGPFALFSVQKTKYIQIFTVAFRWLALLTMSGLAIKCLLTDGPQGKPPVANFHGLPSLFGACVYSFMCHHSLPSLLVPIKNKKHVRSLLSFDYILIVSFYLTLALTGAFAFANLEDLYTLNFIPSSNSSIIFKIIDYFLSLFPVFTLSASFPIIAITLRNNLQALFLDTSRVDSYNFLLRRILFPLLAIVPPFMITYFTENLTSLVGFTGSYAGAGIQYVIPVALVYSSRRTCEDLLGSGVINEYRSPFGSSIWLIFVLLWSFTCMVLVTLNFFY